MAKPRKPYPGLGAFVVLVRYGDVWVAYRGANTEERARARVRELPQWPAERIKVVPNTAE